MLEFPSIADLPFLPAVVRRGGVPADLDSVTSVRTEAEVDPRDVGVEPAELDRVWSIFRDLYRSGVHPAMQICIRREGQVLLDRAMGFAQGAGPEDDPGGEKIAATVDTPFNVFSASKAVTAMLIHLLDQEGLIHLDDPVCEYIPEFAAHGKQWTTVRHVLTHRAGLARLPDDALDLSYLEDPNNPVPVELLCNARPASRAGGRLAYHAITGGFILGEIVRRVTGDNIRAYMDEKLCEPLDWRWMNYGLGQRDLDRVACNYSTGFPLLPPFSTFLRNVLGLDLEEAVEAANDPRFLMGVVPAGNLMATASEMSEFYQLLLEGGELDGVRVFEPRTVWRATSEQSYMEMDYTLGLPLRYGMGFMLGGDWVSLFGLDSRHAFGHLGFTNIVAWADPQRHLAVSIMTSGKPVVYPEVLTALSLVQAITEACPKFEGRSARFDAGAARSGAARASARPMAAQAFYADDDGDDGDDEPGAAASPSKRTGGKKGRTKNETKNKAKKKPKEKSKSKSKKKPEKEDKSGKKGKSGKKDKSAKGAFR